MIEPPQSRSVDEDATRIRLERRPLFAVGTTAVFAILLIVPFALRTVSSAAEPFPAFLFPAGPGQVPTSNGAAGFSVRSVVGRRGDGTERVLDPVAFLAPMPVQYLYALAEDQFGQRSAAADTIVAARLNLTVDVPRPRVTPSSKAAAKVWLRDKLVEAGLSPDVLIIRDEWLTVQLSTGHELSRVLAQELSLDLR